jgi:hypothetical protein
MTVEHFRVSGRTVGCAALVFAAGTVIPETEGNRQTAPATERRQTAGTSWASNLLLSTSTLISRI